MDRDLTKLQSLLSSRNLRKSLLLSSSLLLLACTSGDTRTYDAFQSIDGDTWQREDCKVFCLPRIKETGNVNLTLQLRTDRTFPYTDAEIIAEEQILPSNRTHIDTILCNINKQDGTPLGNGVNLYSSEFPITRLSLHKGDSLTVKIHHNMRRANLPGIKDVGLEVEN